MDAIIVCGCGSPAFLVFSGISQSELRFVSRQAITANSDAGHCISNRGSVALALRFGTFLTRKRVSSSNPNRTAEGQDDKHENTHSESDEIISHRRGAATHNAHADGRGRNYGGKRANL